MALIDEADTAGCRFVVACNDIGLPARTVRRWEAAASHEDNRRGPHTTPHNKLSAHERKQVLEVCNRSEYADLSPRVVVAMLADEGRYVASEATMYRILKEENLLSHRQRSKPSVKREPNTHRARKPNQLWSWDITFLASQVRGSFYKAYVYMDIYSRKIVAAEVFETENSEHARGLFSAACSKEGIQPEQLTLRSDNGAPMKGAAMLAFLRSLSVLPSYSRPSVSNDNAYSESLFRTLKYMPSYPQNGFETLEDAKRWLSSFVEWHNNEHLHSGLNYVTPAQRHAGEDKILLQRRARLYKEARQLHPERWTGKIRNWMLPDEVVLNRRNTMVAGAK